MIVGHYVAGWFKYELHSTKGWRSTRTTDKDTDGFIWERPVRRGLKLKELTPAAMERARKRHIHPRSKRNG